MVPLGLLTHETPTTLHFGNMESLYLQTAKGRKKSTRIQQFLVAKPLGSRVWALYTIYNSRGATCHRLFSSCLVFRSGWGCGEMDAGRWMDACRWTREDGRHLSWCQGPPLLVVSHQPCLWDGMVFIIRHQDIIRPRLHYVIIAPTGSCGLCQRCLHCDPSPLTQPSLQE